MADESKSIHQPTSPALTNIVPRDHGVRGAARGLERELKGIGAMHETHSSEELYSDSPKTASPGALSQAKTIAFCDSNNIMCEHANLAGCE